MKVTTLAPNIGAMKLFQDSCHLKLQKVIVGNVVLINIKTQTTLAGSTGGPVSSFILNSMFNQCVYTVKSLI